MRPRIHPTEPAGPPAGVFATTHWSVVVEAANSQSPEAASAMEQLCRTYSNIVPIYEVGDCEGQPFFSMKFVEGGTLAHRISDFQFPISNHTAAELLVKLARAVHCAHQHGILHRDIKPGNVLLDAQGGPWRCSARPVTCRRNRLAARRSN